jgi:hypothetical protein
MSKIVSFREWIEYQYDHTQLLEMSNKHPEETGLKNLIHVMYAANVKHGPRVKVSNTGGKWNESDNFTVTVEHNPRVIGNSKIKSEHLQDVIDWVKLNHEHLHKVWHQGANMRSHEIENGFKKLGS